MVSYHTLDLTTFSPPEELFLVPNETCAHNQAGISLVGDVCFHWGPLPLSSLLRAPRPGPELGAGLLERPLLDRERRAALTLIIISCLLKASGSWAPDWPTAGWDRVVSRNSTRLRPLQQEQPLGGHSWWNLKEKLAQPVLPLSLGPSKHRSPDSNLFGTACNLLGTACNLLGCSPFIFWRGR